MGRHIGLFEITFWNASVRVSLQEFLVTWHSWRNRCVLEMWEPPPLARCPSLRLTPGIRHSHPCWAVGKIPLALFYSALERDPRTLKEDWLMTGLAASNLQELLLPSQQSVCVKAATHLGLSARSTFALAHLTLPQRRSWSRAGGSTWKRDLWAQFFFFFPNPGLPMTKLIFI